MHLEKKKIFHKLRSNLMINLRYSGYVKIYKNLICISDNIYRSLVSTSIVQSFDDIQIHKN